MQYLAALSLPLQNGVKNDTTLRRITDLLDNQMGIWICGYKKHAYLIIIFIFRCRTFQISWNRILVGLPTTVIGPSCSPFSKSSYSRNKSAPRGYKLTNILLHRVNLCDISGGKIWSKLNLYITQTPAIHSITLSIAQRPIKTSKPLMKKSVSCDYSDNWRNTVRLIITVIIRYQETSSENRRLLCDP
jgi:hypothetical protein